LNTLDRFLIHIDVSDVMNACPVGFEMLHADGKTERKREREKERKREREILLANSYFFVILQKHQRARNGVNTLFFRPDISYFQSLTYHITPYSVAFINL
jgi:hypothetical protein